MSRIVLTLLILTSALLAQEDVKAAYKQAHAMRGDAQKTFAAEQAARFDGQAAPADNLYLGYLWTYAENWSKAAEAFAAFLKAEPKSVNAPNALLQEAICLCSCGRYGEVPAVVKTFRDEHSGHKYLPRMRFCEGRALRMTGDLEGALAAFRAGSTGGFENAHYEVVDCLLQLGRYDEAKSVMAEQGGTSTRYTTARAALPHLGQPLPKALPFDFWTGTELASAELHEQPVVFDFWSTKGGRSRNLIHELGNRWAKEYAGKVLVVGPTVYLKFDPVTMKTEDDMTPKAEQEIVSSWSEQYGVKYPLVLLKGNDLHELCGVDPETPALPCFAVTDKKGVLRYVRVGSADFELEAVEAMLRRVAGE